MTKKTIVFGYLAGTIGNENPFRYKGYYYDKETFMYYCKSRYYVPEWCRWLNGNHIAYLNLDDIDGLNLFTYCENNPVMLVDEEGDLAISIGVAIFIGLLLLVAIAATSIPPTINIDKSANSFNFFGTYAQNTLMIKTLPSFLSFMALDNVLMRKKREISEIVGWLKNIQIHQMETNV